MAADTQVTPEPPEGLSETTRAWWTAVNAKWLMDDHDRMLLGLACRAWDRAVQAREILDREGLVTTTKRGGSRAHPCIKVELECRSQFARFVQQLDLTVPDPKPKKDKYHEFLPVGFPGHRRG